MDGNGNMNFKSWGFEPPSSNIKNHIGFQLISSMAEKPPFGGGGGIFRDHQHAHPSHLMSSINGGPLHHLRVGGSIPEFHSPADYWIHQNREKCLNGTSVNVNHQPAYYHPSYGVSPETSSAHSVQMPQQFNLPKNESVVSEIEEVCEERDDGGGSSGVAVTKKRGGNKVSNSTPKEKKPRTRTPRAPKEVSTPTSNRARTPKKRAEIVINGINMDISEIPIPICSCTGSPQQCYRWGSGGWQSACCTTGMSVYPLPMSMKRRGARIAGRKMSIGAFKKVLEKLASEGYNFSSPIDLRSHWAKHGTNKFVTIR